MYIVTSDIGGGLPPAPPCPEERPPPCPRVSVYSDLLRLGRANPQVVGRPVSPAGCVPSSLCLFRASHTLIMGPRARRGAPGTGRKHRLRGRQDIPGGHQVHFLVPAASARTPPADLRRPRPPGWGGTVLRGAGPGGDAPRSLERRAHALGQRLPTPPGVLSIFSLIIKCLQ
jgi:hypothetical protein